MSSTQIEAFLPDILVVQHSSSKEAGQNRRGAGLPQIKLLIQIPKMVWYICFKRFIALKIHSMSVRKNFKTYLNMFIMNYLLQYNLWYVTPSSGL